MNVMMPRKDSGSVKDEMMMTKMRKSELCPVNVDEKDVVHA